MKKYLLPFLLIIPFIFYSIYSYSQTDPNLVITSNPFYWNFQQQMWQLGYHQRTNSALLYFLVIVLLYTVYGVALKKIKKAELFSFFLTAVIVLVLAYPALSHDLFNYMFNAKMVLLYNMDPHKHIALEFPSDDWLRFMHNTHTPAPYGYGWTALSLLPYSWGFNKFNPTYYAFKGFIVLGLFLFLYVQKKLAKVLGAEKEFRESRWLFFLSPLVLIETVGNVHNDVWMMLFAFLSIWSAFLTAQKKNWKGKLLPAIISLLMLGASVSMKLGTVALLPLVGGLILFGDLKKGILSLISKYWAEIGAVLMFLPLFTARSQQFHPWYLIWSLSFLPFMKKAWLKALFIAFSLSSLLRYVPYLNLGDYTAIERNQELWVTWGGGVAIFVIWMLFSTLRLKKSSHARIK